METLPLDLITTEITDKVDLSGLYAYCQANRGVRRHLKQCQSSKFWQLIGQRRHPKLRYSLPRNSGKIYYTLGKFIFDMNEYLKHNHQFELETTKDTYPSFQYSFISNNEDRKEIKILRLYHSDDLYIVQIRDEDPFNGQDNVDRFISERELEEYILEIAITSSQIRIMSASSILIDLMEELVRLCRE